MANPFLRFALGAAPTPSVSDHKGPAIKEEEAAADSERASATRKRKRAVKTEPRNSAVPVESVKEEPSPEPSEDKRVVQLERIVQLRRDGPAAAIDIYGTQACVFNPETTHPKTQRFQILVAALLSSQTQDPVTHAAMHRMHTQLESATGESTSDTSNDKGLNIDKVRAASVERLQELLVPVGFYRRKAQQMKQIADTLHAQYNGDIPRRLPELLALPGVGPKIARVILLLAWDEDSEGLIVDTHVHRLAQRLGWVKSEDVKTPDDTRKALDEWVPRRFWREFSRTVVGFGQNVCHAVYPKCVECALAPSCRSAFQYKHPSKAKKAKGTTSEKGRTKKPTDTDAVELQYDVADGSSDDFE